MARWHRLLEHGNVVKEKLYRGEPSLGIFVLSCSPIVMELCSTLPLDWLLVDAEASPVSPETILHLFQAVSGSNIVPLVRVPSLDHHIIEHMLDLGAYGVLVPKVDSPEMARAAVEASFYPPRGRRGISPVRASGYFMDVPGHLMSANDRTMCFVQIETLAGLESVEQIAAVDGLDGLFVGPGDLASELGQPGEVTGPLMDEARARILRAAKAHGKIPGIFAYSADLARVYLNEGFSFVAIGNDLRLLRLGIAAELRQVTSDSDG
ncbi:MAG: HpcH/HpaI aldolase family protein [Nitrosospira sp.]|jgi:2-keto-3-deoxy-L-rhamnonate aldolase RhmA